MVRVDAASVIAPMANDVIVPRSHLIKDAEDEAVSWHLPSGEPYPPCPDRWRLNAASVSSQSLPDQGESPLTGLFVMIGEDELKPLLCLVSV